MHLDDQISGWEAVEVWSEVVGDRVAKRTRAVRFRDGTLFVEVDGAAWVNELMWWPS